MQLTTETLLGIAGIFVAVLGIFAASHIHRKYYSKSVDYQLTPYIVGYEPFFHGLDREIGGDLEITYDGARIDALTRLRILVGNDGAQPISDIVEPLKAVFPEENTLLEADLQKTHPDGRNIEMNIFQREESDVAEFIIPLLNPWNYFIAEFLLKGEVDAGQVDFRIEADFLPPLLELDVSPPEPSHQTWRERLDDFLPKLFLLGVSSLIAAGLGYLLTYVVLTSPDFFPLIGDDFILNIWLILGFLGGLGLFLVSLMFIYIGAAETLGDLFQARVEGFDLPSDLGQRRMVVVSPMVGTGAPDLAMTPTDVSELSPASKGSEEG